MGFQKQIKTAIERSDKWVHQSRQDHLGKIAHHDAEKARNSCLHHPHTANSFQRGFLWAQLEESQKIQCNANANNGIKDPRLSQLQEPSGSISPGPKQLSIGKTDRRSLKTSLEIVLAAWPSSSNVHHARVFHACLRFLWAYKSNLSNFWCWMTQKPSMIWESDLGLA